MASVANIYHRKAIEDVSEIDYEVTRPASGEYIVPGLVKVKNTFTDFSTEHQTNATDATEPTPRSGSKQAGIQRAGQEHGVGQELHGAGVAVTSVGANGPIATYRTTGNQLVAAQKVCCYDDAAFKPGHDYEALPLTTNHNKFPFGSNEYLHTLTDAVESNKVNEQTEPNHRSSRRRHNPLNDSVQCKVPAATTSGPTMAPSRVLLLLTVLCLLMSTVAVVLAVLSISLAKDNKDISPAASNDHQRLEQLESTVQLQQTQLSDWFLAKNASDISVFNNTLQLIRSLSDKVNGLLLTASKQSQQISQLSVSTIANTQSVNNSISAQLTFQNNLTSQLEIAETSLNGRIDNMTKIIESSQSRPANLSNCVHDITSTGGASGMPETSSGILDLRLSDQYKDWIITGVLCTTTNGTQAFLKYDLNHPKRYECVCRGAVNGTTMRHCALHYWVCPRTL